MLLPSVPFATPLLPQALCRPRGAVLGFGDVGVSAARLMAVSPLLVASPPAYSEPCWGEVKEGVRVVGADGEMSTLSYHSSWPLSLALCSVRDGPALAAALRLVAGMANAGHLTVLLAVGTARDDLPPVTEANSNRAHILVAAGPDDATGLANVATALAGPMLGDGVVGVDMYDYHRVLCRGGRGIAVSSAASPLDPDGLAHCLLAEIRRHGVDTVVLSRMLINTVITTDSSLYDLDAGVNAIMTASGVDRDNCQTVFTGQIQETARNGYVVLSVFD